MYIELLITIKNRFYYIHIVEDFKYVNHKIIKVG